MIDVNIIHDVTFATSFRGYDKDEVDAFLEELANLANDSNTAAFESERKVAELSARIKKLEESGGGDGSDERARIIREANDERDALIAEAKKTLESARAKEREAADLLARAKAGEDVEGAVASAAVQAKFEDERTTAAARQEALRILTEAKERAKAHTEAANAAIKNAIATAKTRIEAADKAAQERAQATDRIALERSQASDREAFERAQESDRAAKARAQESDRAAKERSDASDRRAQEKADAILAEARGNADHLTGEAKSTAVKMVADAEAKVKEMFARAEASLAAKRKEFDLLRSTSREFSGEYSRLLSEQLREMTALADKMNETVFFGDDGESVDAVIPNDLDEALEIGDTFDALKIDEIGSMLEVDDDATPADADAKVAVAEAIEDAVGAEPAAADDALSEGDDDTYEFVGEPAAPDGTESDLSLSDDDLDRIFAFNVDEIMNEDGEKKTEE